MNARRSTWLLRTLAAATAFVAVACSPETRIQAPEQYDPFSVLISGTPTTTIVVCKVANDAATVGQTVTINTTAVHPMAGTGHIESPVNLVARTLGEALPGTTSCRPVWWREGIRFDDETQVTVSEVLPAGFQVEQISVQGAPDNPANGSILNPATPSITIVPREGVTIWFKNKQAPTPPAPSLSVSKTAGAALVSAGDPISFTITLNSNGPGTATNVTLNDPLPGGTGVNWSISPAVAGCSITGSPPTQTLSCSFGDLASGQSRVITVTSPTTASSCKGYPNTVTVGASNHANVQASASTTVQCASLTITKITPEGGSVNAGNNIQFAITVTSNGPGTAKSVGINDPLPGGAGISWYIQSTTPSPLPGGGSCSISGAAPTQTLICSFGDLASGQSRTVVVESNTTLQSCGMYPNTATASATNHASVQASASIQILCNTSYVGCTPGFWQGRNNGALLWDTQPDAQWTANGGSGSPPFVHGTVFNSFFTAHSSLNGKTMYDLVRTGGGPNNAQKAARSLVAAYLNTAIGLNTGYTLGQLASAWTTAVGNGDAALLALHTQLDAANNAGTCGLTANKK